MPSVLVAEDDDDYREYLVRAALGGGPYRVLEAADGDAAWELLVRERPAVAVLDLGLPGRDSLELLRVLRADPALRRTYVIVLTGARRGAEAEASLAAGADRHLTKPYPADELRRAVAQGLALAERSERHAPPPWW